LYNAGGIDLLHLRLWGKLRQFRSHPKFPKTFHFRGFYFTEDGHALIRENADDSDPQSDEWSVFEEPTASRREVSSDSDDTDDDTNSEEGEAEEPVVRPPVRPNPCFLGPSAFSVGFPGYTGCPPPDWYVDDGYLGDSEADKIEHSVLRYALRRRNCGAGRRYTGLYKKKKRIVTKRRSQKRLKIKPVSPRRSAKATKGEFYFKKKIHCKC